MHYCCMKLCGKNTKTSGVQKDGISFHRFPKCLNIKEMWINATKRSHDWFPSPSSVICSRHFKSEYFKSTKTNNRRILCPNAVPTLHLPTVKEDLPPSDNVFTNHPQLFTQLFCKNCNVELQHTIVEDQTKVLITRVYRYFECEYEELKKLYGDRDLTPLSKFRQRTALATGVSETTVLQILEEEERRDAEKREESKRSRALKRSIQTESSSLEDSSDDSIGDGEHPSNAQEAQNEAEVETLVVKLEPDCDKDQVQINTDSVHVKTEPPDDDVNDTSDTLAVTEPAAIKRRGRKSPRKSDVTPTTPQQQTQGESSTAAGSTAAASSSVRLTEELDESGLSEETEVKMEKIEIGEEGFS